MAEAAGVDLYQAAVDAAVRNNIDPDLFLKLVRQESGFKPRAVSPAGAQGLTQLMPGTAEYLGVSDPFDIQQNLDGGARYLREQLDTFGDTALALAAYNAGPGRVRQYGGVPPFEETQNYVRSILGADAVGPSAAGTYRPPTSQERPEASEAPSEQDVALQKLDALMTAFEMMQGDPEYCPAGYVYDPATESCVPSKPVEPLRASTPTGSSALQRFGISSLV